MTKQQLMDELRRQQLKKAIASLTIAKQNDALFRNEVKGAKND